MCSGVHFRICACADMRTSLGGGNLVSTDRDRMILCLFLLVLSLNCFLIRSETTEGENSEEIISNATEATTLPSNLIMVKTASGKNVILKVMPQSIGDELHVCFLACFALFFNDYFAG